MKFSAIGVVFLLASQLAVSGMESSSPLKSQNREETRATAEEIQALLAAPGPAIDRYNTRCRVVPPPWGQGTPADVAAARLVNIGSPAVPHILKALNDVEFWRRRLATEILGRIGDRRATMEIANRLYIESDANTRRSMLDALGTLADERAELALIHALQDPDAGAQREAIRALGSMKTPRAIETLASLIDIPADVNAPSYSMQLWKSGIAVSALSMSGKGAFPFLLEILNNPAASPRTIEYVLPAASACGDKRMTPILYRLLRHPDEIVRDSAINHLCAWKDSRTVPTLIRILREGSPRLQESASRALLEERSPKALEAIRKALASPVKAIRLASARGLLRPATIANPAPYLQEVLRQGDPETAPYALVMLGGLQDAKWIAEITPYLRHSDAQFRLAAVQALNKFDVSNIPVEPLLQALSDDDSQVRVAALRALRYKRDSRIPLAVQKLTSHPDPDTRYQALGVMNIQNRLLAHASR